jgi:DNA-binding MarR family transcriptional regulator
LRQPGAAARDLLFLNYSAATMGINNDIHQGKFRSAKNKAMVNLLFTYGWTMEQIKQFVSAEDITPQQYNILRILRGSFPQPLSTMQIRERMLDKMSDTSRIVDRLIAKDLVKKSVSATDKRLVDVMITERGQALLDRLDNRNNDLDSIFKNLTDAEASALSNLLDKLRNHQ